MSKLAAELGNIGRQLCAIAERESRNSNDLLKASRPIETDGPQCNQVEMAKGDADPDYVLKELFTYHSPNQQQQKQYETIRDAALHLARVIVKNSPPGFDRNGSILRLRESVMLANAAIALRGLSL